MARLPGIALAFVCGSALAVACDDDDGGGEDHGSDDHGTAEDGTAEHDTGVTGHCAELVSACHDPGEAMGGMAMTCHDVGHDADEAACDAIHEECIALCTGGATTGVDSTGGSGSGTG